MSVDDGVTVHGLHVYVYVLYMRFDLNWLDLTWLDSITVGGNENEYRYSTKKKHTQTHTAEHRILYYYYYY